MQTTMEKYEKMIECHFHLVIMPQLFNNKFGTQYTLALEYLPSSRWMVSDMVQRDFVFSPHSHPPNRSYAMKNVDAVYE